MAKLYKQTLFVQLANAAKVDYNFKRSIIREAKPIFEKEKNDLIQKFETHEVSAEIAAGAEAGNTSKTLGGYGNLSSFIGFHNSENPIPAVSEYLKDNIYLDNKVDFVYNKEGIKFKFGFVAPDDKDLDKEFPTPNYPTKRGWITSVEKGFSNLSYYIYKLSQNATKAMDSIFRYSNSGTGLQMKKKRNDRQYSGPKEGYLPTMLKNFVARLKGGDRI